MTLCSLDMDDNYIHSLFHQIQFINVVFVVLESMTRGMDPDYLGQYLNLACLENTRDGKEDIRDEPCSGRPPTSTTPDNIERVRQMLADDRRLSLRMIAEELRISLDSVSNIIHEHLQKRKKKVYAFPTLRRSINM
ncbi:hypothetical protein AVEN_27529-1 [Araneus ventricosus]|uniref:Paired domain-containing protein n=1 Tax=Araneus ventricosus TaxID=182803 RepID=A0A4Y2J909_ARAVE|nr:hypothetical protein AVEN_27529-1 [Araneus ventricosus]